MRFSIISTRNMARRALVTLALIMALAGCAELEQLAQVETPALGGEGEQATVTRVIDGDTIDVRLNGRTERVRYIGINTPERDEVCYEAATAANAALVSGKQVTLVRDVSETDSYGRLLRYVYVGDVFVNAEMVAGGYAESRAYPPDTRQQMYLDSLERAAKAAGRGCHPTGVFD
jgi:endonuclease YncB( thermonuclease family)